MSKKFSVKSIARDRWNVLDLIKVINKGAVATYLFTDIDMGWVEHLRKRMAERGHRTTVTAMLIKAIALAQLKHPESRSALLPLGMVATFNDIVAGFTVEKFVNSKPVVFFGSIKDPHLKSLEQIARELKQYAEAELKDIPQLNIEHNFTSMPWFFRQFILWLGKTFPAVRSRYHGATFGVSSLGKYGMTAIIPPCVTTSTFGVGSLEDRAVVRDGEIVIRKMMSVTLNFDHRVIDGAPAARFLSDVRALLEGGLAEYITEDDEVVMPVAVAAGA